MSHVIEALQWRYATKKFDNSRYLPEHKIEIIKEAFNLTATSFGLQPVKLLIIKNRDLRQQLVSDSMDQQQVVDASHLLVFCIEKNIDNTYIDAYFKNIQEIRDTPDEILEPYRDYLLSHFKDETPEQINQWSTKQAYLAMGNLLTICAIEEIDACPMEGFNPDGYDTHLGLSKKGLEAVLVMPIGYRATDDMFSGFKKVRKTIEDVILEL